VLPMQDLLGLGAEHRFNVPGTASGNWGWRLLAARLGLTRPLTLAHRPGS